MVKWGKTIVILRATFQWIAGSLFVLIFGGLAILLGILDCSKKASALCSRYFCRTILWITRVRVEIIGKGNIRKGESYLVCANHQGLFDIFALSAFLPLPLLYVSKPAFFKIPVVGWAMRAAGHLKVTRTDTTRDQGTMEVLAQYLKKGRSYVMFPEGTRTRDGSIGPFKMGSFHAASKAEVPVLPISIIGSRERMPRGALTPIPGEISLVVGKPVGGENKEPHHLRDQVREIIVAQYEQQKGKRSSP